MNDNNRSYNIEEIGHLYRTIGALHEGLADSIAELGQRTSFLESEGLGLRRSLNEIEERLGHLLSERTLDRADLHDEGHIAHVGLAADYRSLVMQWMQRVARKVTTGPNRPGVEYDLGRRVASFAEYLFRDGEPDSMALVSSLGEADSQTIQLAESMCTRAYLLRSSISQLGMQHEWDFRTEISGILDEQRQDVWLNCDPAEPVCLVVAPAYVVQGVVYAKQLVATGKISADEVKRPAKVKARP